MRSRATAIAVIIVAAFGLPSCGSIRTTAAPFGQADFESLLETVARGWNTDDARLAASAFASNAIYAEPPAKQLYIGRTQIFEFFGGDQGRSDWMKMVWHNASFNASTQIGAGEFTFSWPGGQVHGIVSIKVENGLISRWREYFYESDLDWSDFQRPSSF